MYIITETGRVSYWVYHYNKFIIFGRVWKKSIFYIFIWKTLEFIIIEIRLIRGSACTGVPTVFVIPLSGSTKVSFGRIGNGTQLMPSVGFPLKNWRLWLVCFQNRIFVVISSTTAYDELEVSNLQTAVDMCQCVWHNHFKNMIIFDVYWYERFWTVLGSWQQFNGVISILPNFFLNTFTIIIGVGISSLVYVSCAPWKLFHYLKQSWSKKLISCN